MYYIVGIVLLLGVLVFIHEFGHFYIAKLCGMKVETFSIGMGHKILKFKRGETEYALSWLPFGGYVKILGQDPREEIPAKDKHRSFSTMPLWKRFAVVIAGPAANFILAFFVFWLLFAKGFPSPSATVHYVYPASSAATAGFEPGDKIVEIANGEGSASIRELSDLQRFLRFSQDKNLKVKVTRSEGLQGQSTERDLNVIAEPGRMLDPMTGLDRDSLVIPGVEYQTFVPLYTPAKNSKLFAQTGQKLLIVESTEIAGTKTDADSVYELQKAWKLAGSDKKPLTLLVRYLDIDHADAKIAEPTRLEVGIPSTADLKDFGFIPAHLLITQILEDSAAEKLGLKKGDIIQELNHQPAYTFSQFKNRLQNIAASGEPLQIKWLRNGDLQEGSFTPQHVERENEITQVKEKKFQLGAMFVGYADASFEKVKAKGLGDGIQLAWKKTLATSVSIFEGFKFLVTGKVSVKAMGGPVMIGKIAGDSLRLGWDYFLKMLAFISLNLCILNLMPLPVLDGGHILLFAVEGIIRRPLPPKAVEIWSGIGFFLIIGLALFVTFNDLTKLHFLAPILKIFGK